MPECSATSASVSSTRGGELVIAALALGSHPPSLNRANVDVDERPLRVEDSVRLLCEKMLRGLNADSTRGVARSERRMVRLGLGSLEGSAIVSVMYRSALSHPLGNPTRVVDKTTERVRNTSVAASGGSALPWSALDCPQHAVWIRSTSVLLSSRSAPCPRRMFYSA